MVKVGTWELVGGFGCAAGALSVLFKGGGVSVGTEQAWLINLYMKLLSVFVAFAGAVVGFEGLKLQNPFDLEPLQGGEPVPGESPFTLCDADLPRLLDIEYIKVDPNPPEKGKNLTIEASGTLKKQVDEGAFVEVDVRYGYIRLVNEKFDLCEQIEHVDMECPLEKGPQTIKKVVELPNEVPPGRYLVNARAFTKEEELITCLSATVDFPYVY